MLLNTVIDILMMLAFWFPANCDAHDYLVSEDKLSDYKAKVETLEQDAKHTQVCLNSN